MGICRRGWDGLQLLSDALRYFGRVLRILIFVATNYIFNLDLTRTKLYVTEGFKSEPLTVLIRRDLGHTGVLIRVSLCKGTSALPN